MCAHKNGDDVPRGTIQHPRVGIVAAFGHLAFWAVMYAVGVALMLGEMLGVLLGGMAVAYVILCAHAGYLFDRVKFRDSDLDPADLMADPNRHLFLRRWAKPLRILMMAEWAGGVVAGWLISPVLGGIVFGGLLAGYLYSGWRPGKGARLKDVAGIKAVLVSGAVVGLGVAAVLGEERLLQVPMGDHAVDSGVWWTLVVGMDWLGVFGMLLIVCGDAVICDLDDSMSDRMYKTQSLPVMIGDRKAGVVASLLLLVGGGVIVFAGMENGSLRMRMVFAAMIIVSGIGIMRRGGMIGGRRDWIDGRMLVVVLAAMLMTA